MRGSAESMTYLRPKTAAEALRELAARPSAVPFAGGTDLMVGWNIGLLNGRTVVDLTGLGWSKIALAKDKLVLGALATHTRLRLHPELRRSFPLLAEACGTVGGVQIQNRGTLGGNLANASPAGDTFPPLAVYEAKVRVLSARGARTLALSELFAGVKKTTLAPGELIEAVELPLPKKPSRAMFRKIGTRAAQAISKTVAAGLLWLDGDGRITELRFALGSMAPTVRRLSTVEAFVVGRKPGDETARKAAELLVRDVSPIDDIRSTREYRLRVSQNLLAAFLR